MALILMDTSAIYALADRADPNHATAVQQLRRVEKHSYILAESAALLQRRLGMEVALRFLRDVERARLRLR
jgi:predicted nucleic acid-binding protein